MSVPHPTPYSWIKFWPSTLWKSIILPTEIKFNHHRLVNRPDVNYRDFSYSNLQHSYNAVLPENQVNKIMGMNITDTTSKEVEEQTRLQSNN